MVTKHGGRPGLASPPHRRSGAGNRSHAGGEAVREARAGIADAEKAAYDEAVATGARTVEEIAAEGAVALTALRQRVEARLPDAIRAVVDMVVGEHPS
ncbi:MAG: hypothetical protein HY660_02980 [Armatimonadetes bacterium]|nr:hypothetical protein [Armatimonadota bacterium]